MQVVDTNIIVTCCSRVIVRLRRVPFWQRIRTGVAIRLCRRILQRTGDHGANAVTCFGRARDALSKAEQVIEPVCIRPRMARHWQRPRSLACRFTMLAFWSSLKCSARDW